MAHGTPHGDRPDASGAACEDCLRNGTRWVELRLCMTCGYVGCCDASPASHATRHFHDTGHPIMRSFAAGPARAWCFRDEIMLELDDLEPAA